jgi:putative transposase
MAATLTNILLHIVFSTKHREPLITQAIEKDLHAYLAAVINGEGGQTLIVNGMPDHVHILARMPHAISVSEMLRRIKGNSSKWANAKTHGHFAWQAGYGAFSVSRSQRQSVIDYIREQREHHRQRSFKEEFLEFLERHEIEHDENLLWK